MSQTIEALQAVIQDRRVHPKPDSYTCKLFEAGLPRILKKVGEEGAEVVIAGALEDDSRLTSETADLVYHLLVLLTARGLIWEDVEAELARRVK